MNVKLKPMVGALGLGLALAGGPAAAGVTWHFPTTTFEDQDVDFLFIDAGTAGVLDVGDVLVAAFEVFRTSGPFSGPTNIAPDELTGVAAVQAVGVVNADGDLIANDVTFAPYSGGLDAILALGGAGPLPGGLGAAGGPAMTAMWLDNSPNLEVAGATNCTSLADCIARATDGTLFQVDGMNNPADPDDDEYWIARNSLNMPYAAVLAGDPGDQFASFNFGLSTYFRGPGHLNTDETIQCSIFAQAAGLCAAGADGNQFVDLIGSGSVLGGNDLGPGVVADGAFSSSDFDYTKQPVPEPASIALFATGLLGLGAWLRRRPA